MASNPMQRKSRNSFLLGMIITLLITGIVIAFLFLQLKQKSDELKAELDAKVLVYALNQDVKANQVLTEDMFSRKLIHKDSIPSNATSVSSVIDTWFLQTKEGEMVRRDKYGLYLDRSDGTRAADTIIEVWQNNESAFNDVNGKTVEIGEYFTYVNGKTERLDSISRAIQDQYGAFLIDTNNVDKQVRLYEEDTTGEFYVYRIDNSTMSTGQTRTRVKEYIDIKNVAVLSKVAMNANTVITPNLIVQSDELMTDDVRQQEYNMIDLPVDLMTNDYIDIRLQTPGGQDFIVVSKARVDIPVNADGTYVTDTIRVNLREDEILAMSSAIVEAYGLLGSKLYANRYVEPAMQEQGLPTYTPNAATTALIESNPNIVAVASAELASRYSESAKNARNQYLQSLIDVSEDYNENIQEKSSEDIVQHDAARKLYLESLNY